jgi:hypothetical protein
VEKGAYLIINSSNVGMESARTYRSSTTRKLSLSTKIVSYAFSDEALGNQAMLGKNPEDALETDGEGAKTAEHDDTEDALLRMKSSSSAISARIRSITEGAESRSIEHPRSGGMQKATTLRVTFSDGTVISDSKAVETLKKCIIKFGPERVAQLCLQPTDRILQLNRVNLVTKRRDEMYANRQHDIGNGWLVFTCSNTPSKKRQIEAIANALNIKVKVEIV